MDSPQDLGFWSANPHLWVPLALLAAFFAGLLLRRALARRRGPESIPSALPPAETPAPAPAPKAAEKAPAPPPPVAPPPATLGTGLSKTRTGWISRLGTLFAKDALTDALYEELEEALLTSDVGPKTTARLLARLKERAKAEKISRPQDLRDLLQAEILALFQKASDEAATGPPPKPLVVMVTGVNGAGKTTTIGKLAHHLVSEGKIVLLGAADTFRAAATEQLAAWAERTGTQMVQGRAGSDPGAVVFDSVKAAQARGADVVLLDTAGRLHTKSGLMDELVKIKKVAAKAMEGAPHEIWLVLDANTGQNAAAQAREFNEALGLTGLVITKLDGTARGGALIGIVAETGLKVRYVGIGERLADLAPFDAAAFVRGLFGGEPG